jgi:H+/Cl- antiporter ClcA
MLPLDERTYRRLLVFALGFGLAGGVFALAYSLTTGWGIGAFFSEPTSELFSGQWWWIPLIGAGALLVVALRKGAGVDGPVPGAVAYARAGWVEPSSAFALVAISAVSLMVGASLGPSFGVVVSGGGFAAWVVKRFPDADCAEQQAYSLTGMAGGFGAIFAAPLFAAVMTSELSPMPKRAYVAAFVPQFIAATVGFVVFFGVTGTQMLNIFAVEGYGFEGWHLIAAVPLGLLSALTLVLYVAIRRLVGAAAKPLPNPYVKAVILGSLIGLIAFAVPLTATGGSQQLVYEIDHAAALGIGLLVLVLLAKMVAVASSQEAGFLGGIVFPVLFIGGTTGLLVNAVVPQIPAGLAVACMLAAVPGAIVAAPVSFVLIGVGTAGLGVEAIAPVGIAVITSYVTVSALRLRSAKSDM